MFSLQSLCQWLSLVMEAFAHSCPQNQASGIKKHEKIEKLKATENLDLIIDDFQCRCHCW